MTAARRGVEIDIFVPRIAKFGDAQPGGVEELEDRPIPQGVEVVISDRGEEAFDAGVAEEQALETVLPRLSRERSLELAQECIELYLWDRLGSDN